MKVLMVGPARTVKGGISGVVNNLYQAGLEKHVEIKYIATMVDGSKWRKLLQAIQAYCLFLFKVCSYDMVHINMSSDSSCIRKLYFIHVAKLFCKKIVIHQHGGDFPTFYYEECSEVQRSFIQRSLNKADKFVVLTQEWKEFFQKIVTMDKLEVLPNAVSIPETYDKSYENNDLLFLGRLCKDKGLRELFQVVGELSHIYSNIHLYLGGVWEEEELRREMEQYQEHITWLGWINGEKKGEMLRKCAIYVLPSYYEGMPVSVLEGMAYGCVPVVTYVGGLKSIVQDGVNGIFVESRDVQSLKQGLERVLENAQFCKELGKQARSDVINNYEINKSLMRLVEIYQQVMK